MSNKKLHVIYHDWHLDPRAGGPTGYLANLKYGLERIENSESIDIYIKARNKPSEKIVRKQSLFKQLVKKLRTNRVFNYYYVNTSLKRIKELNKYCKFLDSIEQYCIDEEFLLKNKNLTSVHCHNFIECIKVINTLKKLDLRDKVKVLLTSHMPEAPSLEISNDYKDKGYSPKKVQKVKAACERVQKIAFQEADILIFPSPEAMEPYYQTIPDFPNWIKDKDIRFIPTGTIGLETSLTRQEAREKFGIPQNMTAVVYIGRHNEVKGYNVLTNVGSEILRERTDVLFLIGGKQNPEFPCLSHQQWKELGWINPAELLKAADLFVLPNKRTYFDLILLETLSMGVPVIASSTGGNISVHNTTDSVELYNNSAKDLKDKILDFLELNKDARDAKCISARKAFQEIYTADVFAENYKQLIEKIYQDYKL